MAAGLGFKTFVTGDVLTATDTNGYLMQGVLVFASAAARDSAITSPQEGQFAYLKDTNVTTYYTGSAWANLDTTGMTNPMTTTGDTIYSSSGSTPARLGIGTAGQVLKVNAGATAPEWATPAAPTFSGVSLYQSASTTSIANNTNTTILFDSESFDSDAYHSTSTNTGRITIPAGKAGKYAINSAFFFQENANGARVLNIYKNGSNYARSQMPPNSISQIAVTLNLVMDLAVSDYIEVLVLQNTGGALNLYGGSAPIQGLFSAYLIGV
jgi:hypothetical protein